MNFNYNDLEKANELLEGGMLIRELSAHFGGCDRGDLTRLIKEMGIKRVYKLVIPPNSEAIKKVGLESKEKRKLKKSESMQQYFQSNKIELRKKRIDRERKK